MTQAAAVRAGALGPNSGSTRTAPVKFWAGPLAEGCAPCRVIFSSGACAPAVAWTSASSTTPAQDFATYVMHL
ncbi:hypothetical protein [Massilia yuzhufengensis]|uniref:hypothetical protein n=1 Tax=Massilia yuzhufengensis TaxID=1164594 RepID=UPI0027D80D5E|nr:hypothetical protein [Massilia yuzhufengensis]